MQPGHCRAAAPGAGRMSRPCGVAARCWPPCWRCRAAAAQAGAPLESQASGLFINRRPGLTAAHAVTGCASLYALKDGQVRRATVVARDARDLALLDTGFKPI